MRYDASATFLSEAEDLLNEIESTALDLGSGEQADEHIHQMFRAFPTIKGSGAMAGFQRTAGFTHHVETLLDAIDKITGNFGTSNASTISAGAISIHTGTTSDLTISGSTTALTDLGLGTGVTQARSGGTSALGGLTLSIAATGGGTATSITFGTGTPSCKVTRIFEGLISR